MLQDILVFVIIAGTISLNIFFFAKSLKAGKTNSTAAKSKCSGCSGCNLSNKLNVNTKQL